MTNDNTTNGRHRRADGTPEVFTQVVIGNGAVWRWSVARHDWVQIGRVAA
ncbi:hypothetical protein SEA_LITNINMCQUEEN_52 [Gordonia phage LitninMcQueen]